MNATTPQNGQITGNLKTIAELPDSTLQLVRDLVEGKITHDPARPKMTRVPSAEKPPQPVEQTPFGYFHKPNHDGRTFKHIVSGEKLTVKSRNVYGRLIVIFGDGHLGTVGDRELELVYLAI
jgi:hypothetical protein